MQRQCVFLCLMLSILALFFFLAARKPLAAIDSVSNDTSGSLSALDKARPIGNITPGF
jgi:hypothetical protein